MRRMSLFQKVFWTLVLLNGGLVAAQDSTTYTIEYGDVLDVIAASYDVSVDCLAESSDIADPNQVRPGDTLVIQCDLLAPIKRGIAKMTGRVYVGNTLVCEGTMTASIVRKDS